MTTVVNFLFLVLIKPQRLKLITHLGIPKENTYAFGDGLNDIDMLEYCQHGIAVGNAAKGLKDIADEITDDIAEDGIYHSIKKHGLI